MQLRLRETGLHDWQFLYDLLAERPKEANISHLQMPSIAEHLEFLRSRPYTAWYIIEDHDKHKTVGSIYLSKQDEIGVFIKKEHQKQGYATQAIELLMQQNKRPRYLANIAPNNMSSQKLFMDMGFNMIQLTFERRHGSTNA